MHRIINGTVAAVVVSAALGLTAAAPAQAAVKPVKYANCTALNKVYKHGVAVRAGVKDKTSGKPVKTYTVNKAVYDLNFRAMDRDKDGIACEKA